MTRGRGASVRRKGLYEPGCVRHGGSLDFLLFAFGTSHPAALTLLALREIFEYRNATPAVRADQDGLGRTNHGVGPWSARSISSVGTSCST